VIPPPEYQEVKFPTYEECQFTVKGSSYIVKTSKYEMGAILPTESSASQKKLAALAVIQDRQNYFLYQAQNLDLDHTTQIKRQDQYISQQLKILSKKSYLTITPCSTLGNYEDLSSGSHRV
jgi:hypothetical protein